MDYTATKIYDEVIIVKNNRGQGYIVEPGNESMLESALHWAGCKSSYVDGKYTYINKDKYIYKYTNGNFSLALQDAAENSWGQGKLSFWNCNVIAPDGNVFLIGINADVLCRLMKQNTFTNGKCQSKVWLGRIKQQAGAFTENMKEFTDAKNDLKLKEDVKSKTSKYKPGDIVGSLTQKYVYLGEFNYWLERGCNEYYKTKYYISNKPEKMHLFIDIDQYNEKLRGEWSIHFCDFRKNKTPMHIFESNKLQDVEQVYRTMRVNRINRCIAELEKAKEKWNKDYAMRDLKEAKFDALSYTPISEEVNIVDRAARLNEVLTEYYSTNSAVWKTEVFIKED